MNIYTITYYIYNKISTFPQKLSTVCKHYKQEGGQVFYKGFVNR